ncbi:small-subunit processome [Panaeolus papilionaceus]|nr:small-subunit processome [Panaeolus papilionaceus]
MTSSLRNSLHRRNHKERSQLAHRAKFGLLEKHKDYVKRAKDYHEKQDRLTRLKQKAALRNKDEFYFAMTKEKTQGGVRIKDRGNAALPTDMVKVLKTQDENYVRTMRASNQKKIDRIKTQLMEMADLVPAESDELEGDLEEEELETLRVANILKSSSRTSKKRKHIIFAEDKEEVTRISSKGKEKASDENNDRDSDHEDESESSVDRRKKLLKELAARLNRDRQLGYTQREFEMQRLMMGKGSNKKIRGPERVEGPDEDEEEDEDAIDARKGKRRIETKVVDEASYRPRVYKWKLERKR